jgi:Tyrosyl-tRNA synthetase
MPEKDEIINRLVKNLAEVITEDEFRERLSSGKQLTHYFGLEISGYIHIGQGLMSALVIKDLQDLGVKCTIWLADWHTAINEKLDGTKETAARIGKGYFTEALKASLRAVGADSEKVEFRLASEWYEKNAMKYWEMVLAVQQHTTLNRMLRSIDIMGREAGEDVEAAKLVYPAMQVADIFFQDIDIAHAGMDQRKAHVIMRDVADKIRPGQPKPVAIHHALLDSLDEKTFSKTTREGNKQHATVVPVTLHLSANKMSKSKPDSAIFIHDSEADIKRKIQKAFCPEKVIDPNPILNWTKHLLFWSASRRTTQPFVVEREEKHGGSVEFETYEKLEEAYAAGEVHPMDLKAAVAKELIELLQPVRDHFAKPEIAAKKAELDEVLAAK